MILSNYFAESAGATAEESVVAAESTATVAVVSTAGASVASVVVSAFLQEARAITPATNINANTFFILLIIKGLINIYLITKIKNYNLPTK
jgi:hypothetical protein